jgi:hypothetical protein
MLSAEDCADNVRGQQRETEQRAVLRLANYSPMIISVNSATVMSGFARCALGLNGGPAEPVLGPDQFTTMLKTSAKDIRGVVGTHP